MEMKELCREEIAAVYERYMVEDFPPDELKPLDMILLCYDSGTYIAYGFYVENKLVAYAYLCGLTQTPEVPVLLDYLAVVKEHRDEGYGSAALALLKTALPRGLMIEAESVLTAENEEERHVRERRISFYERNGSLRQDFETTLFGVRYSIFLLGGNTAASVRDVMEETYRQMVEPRFRLEDVLTFHE